MKTEHLENSAKKRQMTPYPLRLEGDLKEWVSEMAHSEYRSVNAEINRILRLAKSLHEKQQFQQTA